ncbi:hypothetical protein [Dongia deserti]|uniref:hypothetical protein n=1 Tax=Dongia deserti TaxID=2268030 RepID=UPI000E64A890|nr:hypothetical protein [Dongia deserti]
MVHSGSPGQKQHVTSIVRLIAYLLAGPLIWAVQFSIVYAVHTLACAISPGETAIGGWLLLFMVGVTAASVAAALAILLCGRRIRRAVCGGSNAAGWTAYDIISGFLIILSVVAMSWSGVAIGLLETCDQTQM